MLRKPTGEQVCQNESHYYLLLLPSFQVFEGGDIKKIQNLAKYSDDPFHALNYYYDGKLTTSRY